MLRGRWQVRELREVPLHVLCFTQTASAPARPPADTLVILMFDVLIAAVEHVVQDLGLTIAVGHDDALLVCRAVPHDGDCGMDGGTAWLQAKDAIGFRPCVESRGCAQTGPRHIVFVTVICD